MIRYAYSYARQLRLNRAAKTITWFIHGSKFSNCISEQQRI